MPAGEAVMTIVPSADLRVVEAHISPIDIDQVFIGQQAVLRFAAFNQQTTPVAATISHVAADVARDPETGMSYYIARLPSKMNMSTSSPP